MLFNPLMRFFFRFLRYALEVENRLSGRIQALSCSTQISTPPAREQNFLGGEPFACAGPAQIA